MNELATEQSTGDGLRELALFAGAGGGILGGKLLGWRTVCAVEIEPYPAGVLVARQNDGSLPPFPIWDDVRTFDGKPWRGLVDVVSGGFPCQDISVAGKGAGIEGERSGLWREFARIIGEVRPSYVLVENSPALTFRGLGVVLGDLAEMGYDANWGVIRASNTGAPHLRARIWILAYARKNGRICRGLVHNINNKKGKGGDKTFWSKNRERTKVFSENRKIPEQWLSEPDVNGMADGVAFQVDRLAAIGNGQVPAVVKLAWETLKP